MLQVLQTNTAGKVFAIRQPLKAGRKLGNPLDFPSYNSHLLHKYGGRRSFDLSPFFCETQRVFEESIELFATSRKWDMLIAVLVVVVFPKKVFEGRVIDILP